MMNQSDLTKAIIGLYTVSPLNAQKVFNEHLFMFTSDNVLFNMLDKTFSDEKENKTAAYSMAVCLHRFQLIDDLTMLSCDNIKNGHNDEQISIVIADYLINYAFK